MMLKLNLMKRLLQFLIWTVATCTLLRIQKLMYVGLCTSSASLLRSLDRDESSLPSTAFSAPQDVLLTSPFVSDRPKYFVILSYQRSGSSFLGEWFNTNPKVFYNFEPVDSLYSAMYGTSQNENVPSDITNYPNGSARIPPEKEVLAVSDFLQQYLTCDFGKLPVESLLNYYWVTSNNHSETMPYTFCIRSLFSSTYRECETYVTPYCGHRFGQVHQKRQDECYRLLWASKDRRNIKAENHDDNFRKNLTSYRNCTAHLRAMVKTRCGHLLQQSCETHPLRVIKTVRATMKSMQPLLEKLPNFRVIHLIRDPRSAALSRRLFDGNVLGTFSGNDSDTIVKEAQLYCSTVVRDVQVRKRLERLYPGKVYGLVFDGITTNASKYLEYVYRFLDEKPPNSTITWLSTSGRTDSLKNRTSEEISKDWRNVLSVKENAKIVDGCKEFFQLVKHNWKL